MANAVFGAAAHGGTNVGITSTKLGGPLGNRTNIVIYNTDASATLYVGTDASVTTSTGVPVLPGDFLDLDFGPQIAIYGIVVAGTISVRWLEAY